MSADPSARVWIRGFGSYCEAVSDEPISLKQAVRDATGSSVRRISRFIQLALIGSGRCVAGQSISRQSALYLASARGDGDTTLSVVDTLFRDGSPPMPLTFINAVSNAGCYYVASQLGLSGPANYVGNPQLALESALEVARDDLACGEVDSAIVGSVDVVGRDPAKHRIRLGLSPAVAVAEGSHWFWLARGERPDAAWGELLAARTCNDREELIDWLNELALEADACRIIPGQFTDNAEIADIAGSLGMSAPGSRPRPPGYYDSQCGYALTCLLSQPDAPPVIVHINGELHGPRMAAIVLRRITA